jgi:hypothetical protein
MKTELDKQDKILSTIGLKRIMVWTPPIVSVYDPAKFKNYVTSEYNESERKIDDEIYRMFELNLLHIASGLRLTLITSESYDGETVKYKIIRMFIITSSNKELEVIDANFETKIFFTPDKEISFSETNKLIP